MTANQPGRKTFLDEHKKPLAKRDCIRAGKEYAKQHGDEAWRNLCEAWGMDELHPRVKEIFVAGLAMGFVEALDMIRANGEVT